MSRLARRLAAPHHHARRPAAEGSCAGALTVIPEPNDRSVYSALPPGCAVKARVVDVRRPEIARFVACVDLDRQKEVAAPFFRVHRILQFLPRVASASRPRLGRPGQRARKPPSLPEPGLTASASMTPYTPITADAPPPPNAGTVGVPIRPTMHRLCERQRKRLPGNGKRAGANGPDCCVANSKHAQ